MRNGVSGGGVIHSIRRVVGGAGHSVPPRKGHLPRMLPQCIAHRGTRYLRSPCADRWRVIAVLWPTRAIVALTEFSCTKPPRRADTVGGRSRRRARQRAGAPVASEAELGTRDLAAHVALRAMSHSRQYKREAHARTGKTTLKDSHHDLRYREEAAGDQRVEMQWAIRTASLRTCRDACRSTVDVRRGRRQGVPLSRWNARKTVRHLRLVEERGVREGCTFAME